MAAERRHRGLWMLYEQSLAGGVRPIVPIVVLARQPERSAVARAPPT